MSLGHSAIPCKKPYLLPAGTPQLIQLHAEPDR